MERNKLVNDLGQVVIVGEANTKGHTWEGANGALKQGRPLYVRQAASSQSLAGNETLIERGGHPLPWPTENIAGMLSPLLQESAVLQHPQSELPGRSEQLSLFAASNE